MLIAGELWAFSELSPQLDAGSGLRERTGVTKERVQSHRLDRIRNVCFGIVTSIVVALFHGNNEQFATYFRDHLFGKTVGLFSYIFGNPYFHRLVGYTSTIQSKTSREQEF